MKKLFLLAAAFVTSVAAFAQKPDEVIKVSAERYDFGKIKQGIPAETFFTVTNITDKPIFIENAWAGCGCTTPTYSKEPFGAKGSTKVKVGYNAAAAGHFEKDVYVKLAGVTEPKVIKITGEVLDGTAFDAYTKTDEYKKAEKVRLAREAKEAKEAKKATTKKSNKAAPAAAKS